MNGHRKYLSRGVFRLVKGAAVAALVILIFNVAGYHLIHHDLAYVVSPSSWPSSYLGRALLLSFVGFTHFCVYLVAIGLGILVLAAGYFGILYIGGYRDQKGKAC